MKTFTKVFTGLIIMVLCATMLILIPIIGTPSPVMIADKLSNKPEVYFVVTDADPVLLQAISNLGKSVVFSSLDETQVDELTSQYGTPNLEYQNNYYRLGILIGDPVDIYSQILWVSIFGFVISVIYLISLAIPKGVTLLETKETKQTPS